MDRDWTRMTLGDLMPPGSILEAKLEDVPLNVRGGMSEKQWYALPIEGERKLFEMRECPAYPD